MAERPRGMLGAAGLLVVLLTISSLLAAFAAVATAEAAEAAGPVGAVRAVRAVRAVNASSKLPAKRPTTTVSAVDRPKTFCAAWAAVRDVRNTGLTGAASLRLQAQRYQRLVPLAPPDIRPSAAVMAEYFAATLAMADSPLANTKQAKRLEAVIPKIGDALVTVTRHAVRTCPRSLVLATTTTVAVIV